MAPENQNPSQPDAGTAGPPPQLGDLWLSYSGVEERGVVEGWLYAERFLDDARALGAHDDEVNQFIDDMAADEDRLSVFYHGLREGLYGILHAPSSAKGTTAT